MHCRLAFPPLFCVQRSETALLCWTVLGVVVFLAVARRHLHDPRLLLALVLSPAAMLCIIAGQNSLITVAIMVGAFACLDRRPVLAGVLIGLLTLKPQVGFLFPVMLAASGRWRVFFVAAATTVAIAGLFGWQAWVDFVVKSVPTHPRAGTDRARLCGLPGHAPASGAGFGRPAAPRCIRPRTRGSALAGCGSRTLETGYFAGLSRPCGVLHRTDRYVTQPRDFRGVRRRPPEIDKFP